LKGEGRRRLRHRLLAERKRDIDTKMPTYCFVEPKTGHQMELAMTIAEMERQCDNGWIDWSGERWKRDFRAELPGKRGCDAWPMKSDAAGVHPSQAIDFMKDSAQKGVPTEFDTKTGQAIFTGRKHRAKYLKTMGMHDRSGGYGD
jgi:hypothetical protein